MSLAKKMQFSTNPVTPTAPKQEFLPVGTIFRPTTQTNSQSHLHYDRSKAETDRAADPPVHDLPIDADSIVSPMASFVSRPAPAPVEPRGARSQTLDATSAWVTVSGFTDSQIPDVLSTLQRHGTIVHFTKGSGNWMSVQFDSIITAQHCLSAAAFFRVGPNIVAVAPPEVVPTEQKDHAARVDHTLGTAAGPAPTVWGKVRMALFG